MKLYNKKFDLFLIDFFNYIFSSIFNNTQINVF